MAFVFAAVVSALVAAAHCGIIETSPAVAAVAPGAVARFAPLSFAAAPVAKAVVGPPVVSKPAVAVQTDFDPNPQYAFSYEIHDAVTGDDKAQTESRHGDVVQGQYTLVEPDGVRRTVEYIADPVNGFNAVVHRNAATVVKPAVAAAPVVAKVAAHLPVVSPALTTFHHPGQILKTLATPLAYSSPIANTFATPVALSAPAIGKAILH